MKAKAITLTCLALSLFALSGCISIPPLVQVEHKEVNDDIARRLDSIDHRLNQLEKKVDQANEHTER